MLNFGNLLYKKEIEINENIKIRIPTIREILEDEAMYYNLVFMITAMPIDLMVQLDDAGIDFSTIDEYELFIMMFGGLAREDTSLIFGDLDLSKFKVAINEENKSVVLLDDENDITIDRAIYEKIADVLRQIHRIEKDTRQPADKGTRDYMIERARKKLRRRKNKPVRSQLEPLIVSLVNTQQFKYDFEGTKELSIYQFNESVKQIIKKINYDNRMYGVYAGTIDVKELAQEDLSWLSYK